MQALGVKVTVTVSLTMMFKKRREETDAGISICYLLLT